MRVLTYLSRFFRAVDLKPKELEYRLPKNVLLESEKILVGEYLQFYKNKWHRKWNTFSWHKFLVQENSWNFNGGTISNK